jgi:diguanylate cyclase (GGDEF)-like protein
MNVPLTQPNPLALSLGAVSALMPMHLVIGPAGHVQSVGPTLARILPDALVGRRFLEVFEVRRPFTPDSFQDLLQLAGRHMTMQIRGAQKETFKGILVPLAEGVGAIVNLSFGIGLVEAVAHHRLTAGDFAPTDLTIEMLYLVEAKSAAMEESRRLNQKLEGARSAAEEQALTDVLTGLRNRRAMEDTLARLTMARARFGIIHVDLDKFKEVNDTLGHAAGDAVLLSVSKAFLAELREEDLVARVGGDEFVIVLTGITDTRRLSAVARRIIARIEEPVPFGHHFCRISASAGITVSTRYANPNAERMLQDADTALYVSKRAGRARATVHGEMAQSGNP